MNEENGRSYGYLGNKISVRIQVSNDRPTEAQKELTGMAGFDPRRQGTDKDLIWDFSAREWADLFANGARLVPGVLRVSVN